MDEHTKTRIVLNLGHITENRLRAPKVRVKDGSRWGDDPQDIQTYRICCAYTRPGTRVVGMERGKTTVFDVLRVNKDGVTVHFWDARGEETLSELVYRAFLKSLKMRTLIAITAPLRGKTPIVVDPETEMTQYITLPRQEVEVVTKTVTLSRDEIKEMLAGLDNISYIQMLTPQPEVMEDVEEYLELPEELEEEYLPCPSIFDYMNAGELGDDAVYLEIEDEHPQGNNRKTCGG